MVSISQSVVSYEKGSKSKRRYRNQKKRKKERKKEKNTELKRGRRNVGTALGKKKQYETTREKHVQCTRRLIDYWLYLKQVYVVALFFKVIFFVAVVIWGRAGGWVRATQRKRL